MRPPLPVLSLSMQFCYNQAQPQLSTTPAVSSQPPPGQPPAAACRPLSMPHSQCPLPLENYFEHAAPAEQHHNVLLRQLLCEVWREAGCIMGPFQGRAPPPVMAWAPLGSTSNNSFFTL